MVESNKYFKAHTDRRISEIRERTRKFKEEKIKEKMRKISEIQSRTRGRRKIKRTNEQVV